MASMRGRLTAVGIALLLVASGCAGQSAQVTADAADPLAGLTVVTPAKAVAADTALAAQSLDAIFSGSADDHDFNTLAVDALAVVAEQGVRSRYLEAVSVPDAEKVLRAMAGDGATIIWAHGSQFYASAAAVARDYPDVSFIGEAYGRPDTIPDNMWVLDPQFYLGFYALGAFAATLTKTGVIGYISGVRLPFSFSEVHALQQGVADAGSAAEVRAVWTGDFNDVEKAEMLTDSLIAGGADVILGALNGGTVGTFRAAARAGESGRQVWVTAKYTDKSALDQAGVYAGTLRANFTWPLLDVVGQIHHGHRTGYQAFDFSGGVHLVLADSIPTEARRALRHAAQNITSGQADVVFDTSVVDE